MPKPKPTAPLPAKPAEKPVTREEVLAELAAIKGLIKADHPHGALVRVEFLETLLEAECSSDTGRGSF